MTNFKGVEKKMKALKNTAEGMKRPLPDRPRVIYVQSGSLEGLVEQIEDNVDKGFALMGDVKQFKIEVYDDVKGFDITGYFFLQSMVKRVT